MDERTDGAATQARHGIGAVARRTGLTIELIRVWERRYGVVTPCRDGSGRRMYTDADVQRLRLLGQATKAGYAIGQVASLSAAALHALLEPSAEPRWPVAGEVSTPGAEAAADVERALARVRALDGEGLKGVLGRSAALLGTVGFLERVAAPLMRRIGDEWHAGRLTIAGEHLATGIVRSQLAQLHGALVQPADAPVVVVATPTGERHEIGALLVAAAAATAGWRVVYLGPDVPAAEIAGAAEEAGARAVAISTVFPRDVAAVRAELLDVRARLPGAVAVLAGGAGAGAHTGLASAGIAFPGDLSDLRRYLRSLATG